ncbi:NAD(P)-binding domain-containing protein [Robiginitalea sp.]|uniref:NAD(P)-binding domain-containing protein n=1 Tax=Robiginitalea sp. TaxID=1902411 RepID=UPI003C739459
MSKVIGILGCGWLGTPLAEFLLAKGYRVRGSTTREEKVAQLFQKGIDARVLILGERHIDGNPEEFLEGLDCLILNIPPGLRKAPEADFTARIRLLETYLTQAATPHLVFVSSTSVYGATQEMVTEAALPLPDSQTGRQLREAEKILLGNTARVTQILRPGGLLGPDRHPVFTLSGKNIHAGGNERVNLVRRQDLLHIMGLLIANPSLSGIYNAVFPEHPSKHEYYTREASHFGIPPPVYSDSPARATGKKVSCPALEALGYSFAQSIWTPDLQSHPGKPG